MGEGNGTPLQYSCLENPMDGGAWYATVHGVAKNRTRLSDFTFTFHFHALENQGRGVPTAGSLRGPQPRQRCLERSEPRGVHCCGPLSLFPSEAAPGPGHRPDTALACKKNLLGNLDSSLGFIQPSISHNVLCI